MAKRYDARMYEAIRVFLKEAISYVPLQYVDILQDRSRHNELVAMLQGIKSVSATYKDGVRLRKEQLFAENIGVEGRLFALFYMLHLTYICELMVKYKMIRV